MAPYYKFRDYGRKVRLLLYRGDHNGWSVPPKLLGDILLHDRHAIELLLALGCRFHLVVFAEMLNVFGVGQVLFACIYCIGTQYTSLVKRLMEYSLSS